MLHELRGFIDRLSRLVAVMLMTTAIAGCIGYYSEISHLTDDDLEWYNAWEVGDTVLFDSTAGNVDTLVVVKKRLEDIRNPFYTHCVDNDRGPTYEASARYSYEIKHPGIVMEGSFRTIKLICNDSLEIKGWLDGLFSKGWDYSYDYDRLVRVVEGDNPIKPRRIRFKGMDLEECIVFDSCNSDYGRYSVAGDSIESFIISKRHGLISYRFKNGEEYTRRDL